MNHKNGIEARLLLFGALAVLLVIGATFSESLCPYDPYLQNLNIALEPPSSAHILGMDRYGRDMLSRVIAGSRASIFSTLLLVAAITSFGTTIGVFCGWVRGRADETLMRLSDLCLAFPGLVFALAVAGVLGGGQMGAVLALAVVSWPKYARLARGQTLSLRETPFLKAAMLSACSTAQLALKHILPNIAGPILVTAMLDIGTMMMELAGLSFLGLGTKPPAAEWGSMMSENRGLLQTVPWAVFAPGIAIFIAVLVFNLLGDAIRDSMDPKMRKR
ncbi:MAG: ABC transporter permease [Schwartzia sp.]|nr:ABC transporter permease [Schwartzia sp. (in: firmicutes)]